MWWGLNKRLYVKQITSGSQKMVTIDFISKKKGKDDAINFVYNNLSEEEISILEFMNCDEFNFEELPKKYKDKVLGKQEYFMKKNINQYVNKKENEKIEFLKGVKIYEENANIDSKLRIDIPKNKIKRT